MAQPLKPGDVRLGKRIIERTDKRIGSNVVYKVACTVCEFMYHASLNNLTACKRCKGTLLDKASSFVKPSTRLAPGTIRYGLYKILRFMRNVRSYDRPTVIYECEYLTCGHIVQQTCTKRKCRVCMREALDKMTKLGSSVTNQESRMKVKWIDASKESPKKNGLYFIGSLDMDGNEVYGTAWWGKKGEWTSKSWTHANLGIDFWFNIYELRDMIEPIPQPVREPLVDLSRFPEEFVESLKETPVLQAIFRSAEYVMEGPKWDLLEVRLPMEDLILEPFISASNAHLQRKFAETIKPATTADIGFVVTYNE